MIIGKYSQYDYIPTCGRCKNERLKRYRISFSLDMIYSKVSTRLTEGNTLPYQETQTFKDVVREFRKKVIAAERPLISLSQRADKCKDLKQLFPPENEDRGGFTTMSKFEKVVNRLKVNKTLFARDKFNR